MMRFAKAVMTLASITAITGTVWAEGKGPSNCSGLPTAAELKTQLEAAPGTGGEAGGLFQGTRMWVAVVNRDGKLCAVANSQTDPTQVWPGSQAIAKAKAYTANAFSLDSLALSTARLYTFTQPGHSLWSLGQSNPFDPQALAPTGTQGGGDNQINGGMIFFGGGVPIYKDGKIIGGLGISGDTSCTDHEIAKRVRNLLGLNPTGGALVDDITYSNPDGASVFTHPRCLNTYRNGVFIGNEAPAVGY
ncbi:MAG TPA: heme-binding protein [Bryobacteraceae bacterium]|nr:heme-binding protein [Bryobacteraceae bacterium]